MMVFYRYGEAELSPLCQTTDILFLMLIEWILQTYLIAFFIFGLTNINSKKKKKVTIIIN